ncbi:MAG TPA: hypothetical protein PKD92_06590 [Novosphingobium sp.]|nr:hypothetical protein [Novosphingobium sp.]
MKRLCTALALSLLASAPGLAQPVDLPIPPATTAEYPPGVRVRDTASVPVYADGRGLTLYGMDMRTVVRWSPNPALHCRQDCLAEWEPLLAPADATVNIRYPAGPGALNAMTAGSPFLDNRRAPDWTVIEGPAGRQWVYKGWHMVFTRRASKPGSTAFDGHDGMVWNTLKFVPPVPEISAPAGVRASLVDGRYILADGAGRPLFTGRCAQPCTWTPLPAPLAGRGMNRWSVNRSSERPQWQYGSLAVFVQTQEALPRGARHIEP